MFPIDIELAKTKVGNRMREVIVSAMTSFNDTPVMATSSDLIEHYTVVLQAYPHDIEENPVVRVDGLSQESARALTNMLANELYCDISFGMPPDFSFTKDVA